MSSEKEPGQLACEVSGGNWMRLWPEEKAAWKRAEAAVRADEAAKHEAQVAKLREALQDIFDYECRSSSTSLIACTARDALWPRARAALATGGNDEQC